MWTRWLTASPVAKTCIRTLMNINLQMFLPRVLPTSFFFVAQEPEPGLGHLFLMFPDHIQLDKHTVELMWTGDQLLSEAATYIKHKTDTRGECLCPQRDLNPLSQQWSGWRPTPSTARPPGSAVPTIYPQKFQIYCIWILCADQHHHHCRHVPTTIVLAAQYPIRFSL